MKKVEFFSISKIGNEIQDNKDSIRFNQKERRFAISDGVSGTSYSKEWANLLTESFVEAPFNEPEPDIKKWIYPLQVSWYNSVPWDRLINSKGGVDSYEKAMDGAAATFLAGVIEDSGGKVILKAWALGDTNLFIVRNDENVFSFPLKSSEDFSLYTSQIFSTPKKIEPSEELINYVGKFEYMAEEIHHGDIVICSSDSISKWYLESIEHKTLENISVIPWHELLSLDSEEKFHSFIREKIDIENMKNDDSTLLVMKF